MTVRTHLIAAAAVLLSAAAYPAAWKNVDAEHKLGGRTMSDGYLRGKVVMLYNWGVADEESAALLPRIEKIWSSFKSKPFVMLGSHVVPGAEKTAAAKAKVAELGLTFPNYSLAGVSEDGRLTLGVPGLICVYDPAGTKVYAGHDERDATEAVVNAFELVGGPTVLCSTAGLKKLKSKKGALALGKNYESVKKDLVKIAAGRDKVAAAEAEGVMDSVERTRKSFTAMIDMGRTDQPAQTYSLLEVYRKTWPTAAKDYDELWQTLSGDPEVVKCAKLIVCARQVKDAPPAKRKAALAAAQAVVAESGSLKTSANAPLAQEAKNALADIKWAQAEL